MQAWNIIDTQWGWFTMRDNELDDVYGALRAVMLRHADGLVVATDSATHLSIETRGKTGVWCLTSRCLN